MSDTDRYRKITTQWFIKRFKRGIENCFIIPLQNRCTETIVNTIQTFIRPETVVVTDKWRAYAAAFRRTKTDIDHLSVKYSLNFVDSEYRNIHT